MRFMRADILPSRDLWIDLDKPGSPFGNVIRIRPIFRLTADPAIGKRVKHLIQRGVRDPHIGHDTRPLGGYRDLLESLFARAGESGVETRKTLGPSDNLASLRQVAAEIRGKPVSGGSGEIIAVHVTPKAANDLGRGHGLPRRPHSGATAGQSGPMSRRACAFARVSKRGETHAVVMRITCPLTTSRNRKTFRDG